MTQKRCTGRTAKGTQCKNAPVKGHLVCNLHMQEFDSPGEELMEELANAMLNGSSLEVACAAEGLNPAEVASWMDTNAAGFRDLVEKCYAQVERDCMESITSAAKRDWRAAVWLLERKPNSGGSAGVPPRVPLRGGAAATATGPSSGNPEVADDQVDADGRSL